jgi:hypothetical protein
VGRAATAAEIRDAYLRRSKQLHPDRLVHATDAERAAATRAMQDVTAAYEVLRDGKGAHEPPPSAAATYAPPAWPPPASPRRTRLIVIGLAVLAVMSGLVLSGSGSSKPLPDPKRADDLTALNGQCLTLERDGRFKDIVDCTRPHDARVVAVVDRGVSCPIYADQTLQGPKQDLCLDMVVGYGTSG